MTGILNSKSSKVQLFFVFQQISLPIYVDHGISHGVFVALSFSVQISFPERAWSSHQVKSLRNKKVHLRHTISSITVCVESRGKKLGRNPCNWKRIRETYLPVIPRGMGCTFWGSKNSDQLNSSSASTIGSYNNFLYGYVFVFRTSAIETLFGLRQRMPSMSCFGSDIERLPHGRRSENS